MIKASHAQISEILKTLPIGLYLGDRTPVIYEESGDSYANLMDGTIHVSGETVMHGLAHLPSDTDPYETENGIRAILYHELSHIIMTPKTLKNDSERIVNCFEDERIETLLGKYYLGVNFKKMCMAVNGWTKDWMPSDAREYFYGIVRFRQGPAKFVKRVSELIRKWKDIRADASEYRADEYREDIEDFYHEVLRDWNQNRQQRQDEQQERNDERNEREEQQKQEKQNQKNQQGQSGNGGSQKDRGDQQGKGGGQQNESADNDQDKGGSNGGADEKQDKGESGNGSHGDDADEDNGKQDGNSKGAGSDSQDGSEDSDERNGGKGGNSDEGEDGNEDGDSSNGSSGDGSDGDSDGSEGEDSDGNNSDSGSNGSDDMSGSSRRGNTSRNDDGENADEQEKGSRGSSDGGEESDGDSANGSSSDVDEGEDEDAAEKEIGETVERGNGKDIDEITRESIARDVKRLLGKFHDEKVGHVLERLIIQHNKRRMLRTPMSRGYTGKVGYKEVATRRDYRWFVRKGGDGQNMYGSTHFTLWVDCSGSFCGEIARINSVVHELNQLARRIGREFSFDVVQMTMRNKVVSTTDELTSGGCNGFGPGVEECIRKTRRQGCNNYNVVVWDGDMFSGFCRNERERYLPVLRKAFNNQNTVIVTDGENERYTRDYTKNARVKVIHDHYSTHFVDALLELLAQVLV